MRFIDVLIVCIGTVLAFMVIGPRVLRVYTRKKVSVLTPKQLDDKIKCTKDIVLLDVRKKKNFNNILGHIKNSVNVPLEDLAVSLASNRFEGLLDVPLVVIDEADSFAGLRAYKILKEGGFKDVYLLEGGVMMWLKNRLPTVKGD